MPPPDLDLSFRPSAPWPALVERARLLRRAREFFDSRGFLEVETPILSADVVVDRHLEPLGLCYGEPAGELLSAPPAPRADAPHRAALPDWLWLQTSPEFHMKRMMAAGGEAIYQITRAFRRGEFGPRHNPEFTIVEWYRRGDDLAAGMALLGEFCDWLLETGRAEPLTYQAAFEQHLGIDPLSASIDELRAAAKRYQVDVPASYDQADRDAWLDLLLVERIEPHLGQSRPTILYHYPVSQAALARTSPDDPRVAERFELYVRGVELANGYHELVDADVLRDRNRSQNALRRRDGKRLLPAESRLLDAMEFGLPACTGVALGFDRVVMLRLGAKSIAEVLAFPVDRA